MPSPTGEWINDRGTPTRLRTSPRGAIQRSRHPMRFRASLGAQPNSPGISIYFRVLLCCFWWVSVRKTATTKRAAFQHPPPGDAPSTVVTLLKATYAWLAAENEPSIQRHGQLYYPAFCVLYIIISKGSKNPSSPKMQTDWSNGPTRILN